MRCRGAGGVCSAPAEPQAHPVPTGAPLMGADPGLQHPPGKHPWGRTMLTSHGPHTRPAPYKTRHPRRQGPPGRPQAQGPGRLPAADAPPHQRPGRDPRNQAPASGPLEPGSLELSPRCVDAGSEALTVLAVREVGLRRRRFAHVRGGLRRRRREGQRCSPRSGRWWGDPRGGELIRWGRWRPVAKTCRQTGKTDTDAVLALREPPRPPPPSSQASRTPTGRAHSRGNDPHQRPAWQHTPSGVGPQAR